MTLPELVQPHAQNCPRRELLLRLSDLRDAA
jgi:hypothetical protein